MEITEMKYSIAIENVYQIARWDDSCTRSLRQDGNIAGIYLCVEMLLCDRGTHILQKSGIQLKILGARCVTWGKSHANDPQIKY
jgi:hypothetical protein